MVFSLYHSPFSRWQIHDIFLFFLESEFEFLCKLFPLDTVCMKCQNLFTEKKKKKKNIYIYIYFIKSLIENFTQNAKC